MAQAIFNSIAPEGWRAESAGTAPAEQVDPAVRKVLAEVRLTPDAAEPRLLSKGLIDSADIVITMGCGDDRCPAVPIASDSWQLEDPKGQSIEQFRRVRDEIAVNCVRLIECIRQKTAV